MDHWEVPWDIVTAALATFSVLPGQNIAMLVTVVFPNSITIVRTFNEVAQQA